MSENAKRIVISVSPYPGKNVEMVVYHNVLPNGKKDSITRFEVLNSDRPAYKRVFPKGLGR